MSFSDEIRTLAGEIERRRSFIETEEATKQALILPFLEVLGFDIYNPAEVVPEYRAGWAHSSEKVDYALKIDDEAAIFVEAKGAGVNLNSYTPQLAKYFNSETSVRFAVLANGVQYQFFTDLESANILDRAPFFVFNFEAIEQPNIEILARFSKEAFDQESLSAFAEDLVYKSALQAEFVSLIRNPSDALIRFIIRETNVHAGRVTQRLVDRFEPLVKESLSAAILKIVGESFQPKLAPEKADEDVSEEAGSEEAVVEESKADDLRSRIETTTEELKAYEIVRELIESCLPNPEYYHYRDAQSYFVLVYDSSPTQFSRKWFARLRLGPQIKSVQVRLPLTQVLELAPGYEVREREGGPSFEIASVDELRQLGPLFEAAVKGVM